MCMLCRLTRGMKRKIFLLLSNIIFYSSNSFFSLIILISLILITYCSGLLVNKFKNLTVLTFTVIILLSPLIIFKYLNFFLSQAGMNTLHTIIILPLGISFYTFQALGYIFDVFRDKVKVEFNILDLSLFLSMFFCHGGPIERTESLLRQIREYDFRKNTIDVMNYSIGFRRLLYGCFLKIFVAENIAIIVNNAYSNVYNTSGIFLLISTVLFGLQLYCDFSGYSLMAMGSASCLGFNIVNNFNSPYLSVSVTDFWRRWHISLSTWFRDYVYIPFGGNRCSKLRTNFNRLVTFTLSGLWHGANWTFVIWGLLNGLYLCFESELKINSVRKNGINAHIGRAYTWIMINLSWIYFRAPDLKESTVIIKKTMIGIFREILSLLNGIHGISDFIPFGLPNLYNYTLVFIGVIIVVIIDILRYKYGDLSIKMSDLTTSTRWSIYLSIATLLMVFGSWTSAGNFIYLNF